MTSNISREYPVHVIAYRRFVRGMWQDVCSHYRSRPKR